MTDQELFDFVAKALLAQGKPAIRRFNLETLIDEGEQSFYWGCAYRTEDGCKCAAGHLIPDDLYDPSMERKSIESVADSISGDTFQHVNINLLCSLQIAHDSAALDHSSADTEVRPPEKFLENWKYNMRRIADTKGLNPAVLEATP